MNISRLFCVLMQAALLVSGCGGSPAGPAAPTVDLSGAWQGTYSIPAENPGRFTLQLAQTGQAVNGSAQISQNEFTDVPASWTATVSTASGMTMMPFVMSYTFGDPPCPGTFKGTLSVTPTGLEGAFTGENCTRTFAGTLHVERLE
jgi:hypothetical protein